MSSRKISFFAMFVALSVVGGLIKIPAPVASVALDSCPALVAAGLLGPAAGALVAGFGHLAAAGTGGFPLGPLHILVALEMMGIVWLFGKLYERRKRGQAIAVFSFLNGVAAPAAFIPFFGVAFYMGTVVPLVMAASFNGLLALFLLPKLKSLLNKKAIRLDA